MIILFLDVNIYQNCDIYSQSIHGVNVRLAINLTMTTRRRASIRNYLDSSNPANWTSEELKVELEKIGIKLPKTYQINTYVGFIWTIRKIVLIMLGPVLNKLMQLKLTMLQ